MAEKNRTSQVHARRAGSALVPSSFFVALLCLACLPEDPPGESLGSYQWTGDLMENSCGFEAFTAIDPFVFRSELREEGDRVFWRQTTGQTIEGVAEEGGYAFQYQSQVLLYDAIEGERGACAVTQIERINVEPTQETDEGTPVHDALGTSEVVLSPIPGSDCSLALLTFGGPFLELPCRVEYELTGDLDDDEEE